MSTTRIHMSAASADLVISKVGYDASDPNLADANKIFDSDWLFCGSIITKGIWVIPCNGVAHTIPFPEQPEPPAVSAWNCYPPGYYASPDPAGNLAQLISALTISGDVTGTVTTTGLVIPASTYGNVFLNKSDAQNAANSYQAIIAVVHGF